MPREAELKVMLTVEVWYPVPLEDLGASDVAWSDPLSESASKGKSVL